jgi:hypothetical protein
MGFPSERPAVQEADLLMKNNIISGTLKKSLQWVYWYPRANSTCVEVTTVWRCFLA